MVEVGGDVTSYSGKGIDAVSGNGAVGVIVAGAVTSQLDGVTAQSNSGAINVEITGDVLSHAGKGILASGNRKRLGQRAGGGPDPAVSSDLTSKLDAITARSDDNAVTVRVTGDLDGKGVPRRPTQGSSSSISAQMWSPSWMPSRPSRTAAR